MVGGFMPVYDADGKIILPLPNAYTFGKTPFEVHLLESLIREVNALKDQQATLSAMSQRNQSS